MLLKMFEDEICKYTGAPYCVLTDSCSNAIFLCLEYKNRVGDIEPKSILEIPKFTYMSVPAQIVISGHIPKLTDNKWEKIYGIGDTNIIDSAVMFHENMYVENSMMCCSFHSQKILNIDKGGCILLDDKNECDYIRRMSWDGRNVYRDVSFDMDNIIGYHMNMTPKKASEGLVVLSNLPKYHPLNDSGKWSNYPDLTEFDAFRSYV